MYTTRCVMAELRSMGDDVRDSAKAGRKYALHTCGHEHGKHVPAAECLREQIGGSWAASEGAGGLGKGK